MIFSKNLLLVIVGLSSVVQGATMPCDTFRYQTITGKDTTVTVFTLSQLEHGKKARAEYHRGGITSFSEVNMTDSFITRSWRYRSCGEKSDLSGSLGDDTVVLKGTFKNKSIDKKMHLTSAVWKQMFPFDLMKFVLSDSCVTQFCGVSIIDIAPMQLGTLAVTKIGMEHVNIHGKDMELLHIKVAPPGFISAFWHGDYWFKKECGTMVKSVSFDYPGGPPVVSTLEN